MWKTVLVCFGLASTSLFFSLSISTSVSASPDANLGQICTRDYGSNVVLRTGPGGNHPRGLSMLGSGGKKVDDYFKSRNYTIASGEEVSVQSTTIGTDNRTWHQVGTNQWSAWVRSDFVCR